MNTESLNRIDWRIIDTLGSIDGRLTAAKFISENEHIDKIIDSVYDEIEALKHYIIEGMAE